MIASTLTWHTSLDQPFADCSPQQWQWLTCTDSLTARLRQISGNTTRIELLSASWSDAYPEEITWLQAAAPTDSRHTWIREIMHFYGQQPLIWARVVIPAQTLRLTQLDGSTTQPLGDILSLDSPLTRTALALAQLPGDHPYCHQATLLLSRDAIPLWARRSILWFKRQPLLVIEVFLSEFFTWHP
jgi:chorismate lyase